MLFSGWGNGLCDTHIPTLLQTGLSEESNITLITKHYTRSDGQFGTDDGVSIGGTLIARIASIVIGTQVAGTPSGIGTIDHFGFVAERIGSFRAELFVAPLTTGTDVAELSPTTGDVTLHKVYTTFILMRYPFRKSPVDRAFRARRHTKRAKRLS